MKILVLIPAYNCEKQISRVINQFNIGVSEYFDNIMVIDNNSTDNTANEAIKAFKENKHLKGLVSRNKENIGYGGTLKTGFKYAIEKKFNFLLILHGDDQGKVINMVPHINDHSIENYDCTLGARFHPASRLENYSWFRIFGNKVFNKIFSIFLNKKILDCGSGINIYKLDSFKEMDFLKFTNDLTFDYCGIISHSYRQRKIRFVPITWSEDDQVSNVKMFKQSLINMYLILSYFINKKKFILKDKSKNEKYSYEINIIFKQDANN